MTTYLFYDTETSGFLTKGCENLPKEDQPWIVQMGMILANEERDFARISVMIRSRGRKISEGAERIHKISTADCENGISEVDALLLLCSYIDRSDIIVCHNVGFDLPMTRLALRRNGFNFDADNLEKVETICTMQKSTAYCQLPAKWKGYKWPKLEELHEKLFGFKPQELHDALADCEVTKKCFFELKERGII